MSSAPRQISPLGTALRGYLDARSTALLAARKELRINEVDARVLLHVVDNPGTRPVEVKNLFGLTSAGVTVLIDRLVERGALRRDRDLDDRRSVRLVATIDVADGPWAALTRFDDGFESVIQGLGPDEVDGAADLISRLTRLAGSAA